MTQDFGRLSASALLPQCLLEAGCQLSLFIATEWIADGTDAVFVALPVLCGLPQ